MKKVLIADNHPLFREYLKQKLAEAEKMLLASEKKFPKLYQRNQQKLVALYALEQAKAEVRRLFSYHKICAQQRDYIPQPYVRTRAS